MDGSTGEATTARAPRTSRRFEDLPGPRGWPVVGNALQVDTPHFHLQLEQWAREFGPFYQLTLRKRRLLVVGDHETVAAVLRDRPDGLRRTARLEEIWNEMGLVPGLFGANGDVWRRQRRMVMAGFDPAHVKRYFPSLLKVSQRLGGRWREAARQGRVIDLQADLMRFTVDTIAGLAFGAEVNTLESDGDVIQQHLDRIFPALFRRLMAPLPYWRWFKLPADRALERSVAEVKHAISDFIARYVTKMKRSSRCAAGRLDLSIYKYSSRCYYEMWRWLAYSPALVGASTRLQASAASYRGARGAPNACCKAGRHSTLMLAALIIGHHFSISAF